MPNVVADFSGAGALGAAATGQPALTWAGTWAKTSGVATPTATPALTAFDCGTTEFTASMTIEALPSTGRASVVAASDAANFYGAEVTQYGAVALFKQVGQTWPWSGAALDSGGGAVGPGDTVSIKVSTVGGMRTAEVLINGSPATDWQSGAPIKRSEAGGIIGTRGGVLAGTGADVRLSAFSITDNSRSPLWATLPARRHAVVLHVEPTSWTPEEMARRFDVLILSPGLAAMRDAIKAVRPDVIALRYVPTRTTRNDWDEGIVAASTTPVLMKTAGGANLNSANGTGPLLDLADAAQRTAAATRVVTMAAGWDGIFLDEVGAKYSDFAGGAVAAGYPVAGPEYGNAMRGMVQALTTALTNAGKVVAANINGEMHDGAFLPTAVMGENPGLLHPFIEAGFGVGWDGARITESHGMWWDLTLYRDFLSAAESAGRSPIMNAYSNDPAVLRYAYALFLREAGGKAVFAGHTAGPGDIFNTVPVALPEYSLNLGSPTGSGTWKGGTVTLNTTAGTASVTPARGQRVWTRRGVMVVPS